MIAALRRAPLLVLLLSPFSGPTLADDVPAADRPETTLGGHLKARLLGAALPADSLFRDSAGAIALDAEGDLRLNLELDQGSWSLRADYQLFFAVGDQARIFLGLPGDGVFFPRYPNDDLRLMDLTDTLAEGNQGLWRQRLDRLWVGWTGERTVLRVGRQSLSWGNGLFYAPMDLVNPFDPAAVDTEYKLGDDMLYGQWLRGNGDDLQGAVVARRDPVSGDVQGARATVALKYHGFAGAWEYDLLAAQHYDDPVAGVGLARSVGGGIWRADLVVSDTDNGTFVQALTNFSQSWVAWNRNMSGSIELFYNGFGLREGPYDGERLADNPELLQRLARGELFSLGRYNLAASVLVEMTPLWTVSPTVLANLGDDSALFQLITQVSLAEEAVLLGSLNLPLGANGTEFGGIAAPPPAQGRFLSTELGVFLQLARYF